MGRVLVTVRTKAPPERVWRALTDPTEVSIWDGVVPRAVPAGYPVPGQHARWRTRVGPVPLTLHDRVRVVDEGRRLASDIDVGFVHVEEEYRLEPTADGTRLVSDNAVRSRLPGLGGLADRMVRRSAEAALARLRELCDRGA
jgi:uncharacterized protein YndB with AHSA1/START domain